MSYIPDIHQDFYTEILAWPTTQADFVDNEDLLRILVPFLNYYRPINFVLLVLIV